VTSPEFVKRDHIKNEEEKMFERIKNFFREVKIEIKKVVFPSMEEVKGSTKVVVVMVLIIAIFLGLIDLLLSKLVGMAVK
jgi:preprotein translocase subunit SecE